MSEHQGRIIVVSAASGSGKTTIVRNLLSEMPELQFSISATTRDKRENEIDGKHYRFITELDFENKIRNNEFIEWEQFYDYYYGTLRDDVESKLNSGISVVLEVDVKGAVNIKRTYENAVLIFIMPPSIEVLKERLIQRNTESKTDLRKRFERMEMELSYKDKFDYVVVNDKLERAQNEVLEIVKKEISEDKLKWK
jgi:guanylate kinase